MAARNGLFDRPKIVYHIWNKSAKATPAINDFFREAYSQVGFQYIQIQFEGGSLLKLVFNLIFGTKGTAGIIFQEPAPIDEFTKITQRDFAYMTHREIDFYSPYFGNLVFCPSAKYTRFVNAIVPTWKINFEKRRNVYDFATKPELYPNKAWTLYDTRCRAIWRAMVNKASPSAYAGRIIVIFCGEGQHRAGILRPVVYTLFSLRIAKIITIGFEFDSPLRTANGFEIHTRRLNEVREFWNLIDSEAPENPLVYMFFKESVLLGYQGAFIGQVNKRKTSPRPLFFHMYETQPRDANKYFSGPILPSYEEKSREDTWAPEIHAHVVAESFTTVTRLNISVDLVKRELFKAPIGYLNYG
ncbi:hypothetical protein CFIMG_001372RA [Ceratocystis fimbriata CBS 114723]|uniref:Uncharacterized protein n=1 Tax=Ceratocystis fimbriata CBS 114723 TaxID=1035309 RepID=A0A2C5XHE6_9PEZI|nr:hypothetical protein CFIMG_001372RA [Ceratocystis fimbriata CBS 114723]